MYTDQQLQQSQENSLPFTQGPQDPAVLQDYINSQNLTTMDPSMKQATVQQPQPQPQAQQTVAPVAPTNPPEAPQQQVAAQTQPPVDQSQPQQATQPPAQQPTQQEQPQPGSAEYMNQEAQNVSNPPAGLVPEHALAYEDIQQDPGALLNYAKNPTVPEHMQTQAVTRAGDLMANERDKKQALQKISSMQSMQPTELASALKERTTGGSWVKAILFGALGMHNLAQDEAAKLGIGKDTTVLGPDGKAYMVKMAANGTPLEGFSAESGKKLTPEELVHVSANGSGMVGAQTSQTMGFDKNGDPISHTVLKNGNVIWKNQKTGETLAGAPEGYHTGKNQQETMAIQAYQRSLQNDEAKNRSNVARGLAPLYTKDEMEQRAQGMKAQIMGIPTTTYGGGVPTPQAPNEQAATSTTTPATAPVVPGSAEDFAKANGIPVSPHGGTRTTQDQANQLAQWYQGGMKGPRPAEPGTSAHETGNAIDIPQSGRTPENRAKLEAAGYVNTVPGEPWHFEKKVTPQKGAGNPTISDVIQKNAEAIANYESPPLTGSGMGGQNAIIMSKVRELNPNFDASKFKIAQKTRQDFTTGKQGQAVQSMNVAVDHLDTLDKAAKELNNGNIPLFNSIAQSYAKNTGQSAPTNFDALKSIVGSEVAKAVSGGASALGDREEIRREIDKANSPQQLAEVIKKYQQLMAGQLKGLKQTYESADLKDFDKKLLPRTVQVLNSVQESTRSKW